MASKSCKEFPTVKSRTVFKLFRHRVNASSNSATVTFFTVFKMCRHRVNAVSVIQNLSMTELKMVERNLSMVLCIKITEHSIELREIPIKRDR